MGVLCRLFWVKTLCALYRQLNPVSGMTQLKGVFLFFPQPIGSAQLIVHDFYWFLGYINL